MRSFSSGTISLILLGWSVSVAALADSWESPSTKVYSSKTEQYRFTVVPAGLTARDQTGKPKDPCKGRLERRTPRGGHELVWERQLVNPVSPVNALVSSNGKYVVTFDNWHHVGRGQHVVVIYGPEGKLVRDMALTDFLTAEQILRLRKSVSSTWWGDGHSLDAREENLVLRVVKAGGMFAPEVKPEHFEVRVLLKDGSPIRGQDSAGKSQVIPLAHAHAHNDYEHQRPLLDALVHGFCSVEADVFLVDGRLLVGHTQADLKPDRTLENLYLEPLRQRAKAHGGRVFSNGPTFYLLVDVKTAADATYRALDRVLAGYADILTVSRAGKVERKAVTVVLSGNRAQKLVEAQHERYLGIDGRLTDLDSKLPADLLPWISDRWGAQFRWNGEGAMPAEERDKLRDMVQKAHARGRLIRFWATPEKTAVWQELRSAGVDLINTDRLADLQSFLLQNPGSAKGTARP